MSQEAPKPFPDILRPMAVMLAITLALALTASAVMASISHYGNPPSRLSPRGSL